jgi:hypothetical protein
LGKREALPVRVVVGSREGDENGALRVRVFESVSEES